MLKITGTFLDEITWDIPHQNWSRAQWQQDFKAMKNIGIDTVIMIRSGLRRFMTWDSKVLSKRVGAFTPPEDLVTMFLDLAEENDMQFYFGTYDFGRQCTMETAANDVDVIKAAAAEAWEKYGTRKAFKGWYLSVEISRNNIPVVDGYAQLGKFLKDMSGNLPVLISPLIQGVKAVGEQYKISPETHYKEWNEIMGKIEGAVDILAFQDGHVDYDELPEYLQINAELARKHGMESWTNCETFDRDMPIHFLPIKWEKMWNKLRAAERVGFEKAITFEFSHFMSPNSMYISAHHLYDRYCEYVASRQE